MKEPASIILGQKNAEKTIEAQVKKGLFTHAYLIIGNDGVGKKYFAQIFAKKILTEGEPQKEKERQIQSIEKRIHPDLIIIDGEEGIKIEEIRELIERINLSPNISKRKVALIYEAGNMGIEAANALLKTLEEPPEDSVIILTGVSELAFPETITSRTQKIKLQNLSDESIKEILSEMGFNGEEADKAVALSQGRIGEAIKVAGDKNYAREREKLYKAVIKVATSSNILETFSIIDSFEKDKKLEEFFNIYTTSLLSSLDPDSKHEYAIKLRETTVREKRKIICNKIILIRKNMNYNINLRMAMEGLILECQEYD